MLLKSGADTNLKMTDGRTPLHIAAESGSIAVLKLLLAHDANALNPDMVSINLFITSFSCGEGWEKIQKKLFEGKNLSQESLRQS